MPILDKQTGSMLEQSRPLRNPHKVDQDSITCAVKSIAEILHVFNMMALKSSIFYESKTWEYCMYLDVPPQSLE